MQGTYFYHQNLRKTTQHTDSGHDSKLKNSKNNNMFKEVQQQAYSSRVRETPLPLDELTKCPSSVQDEHSF